MLTYQENNIEFRISSAEAIAEFKEVQAHSFLQLSRREFDFDKGARECVLLSYDRFSAWLLTVERMFLAEKSNVLCSEIRESVIESFIQELRGIERVCEDNPHIFSPMIIEYLNIIHAYTTNIIPSINSVMCNSTAISFSFITGYLSDYLQHLLLSMHEYNNNIIKKRAPFICISKFSFNFNEFQSAKNRIAFHRKYVGDGAVFKLQNYTDNKIDSELLKELEQFSVAPEHALAV